MISLNISIIVIFTEAIILSTAQVSDNKIFLGSLVMLLWVSVDSVFSCHIFKLLLSSYQIIKRVIFRHEQHIFHRD